VLLVAAIAAFATEPGRAATSEARRRHASLTRGVDCSACHTPDGWQQLAALAGSGFDHARTGFPLTERHRAVACVSCHRPERALTRQCAGCHQDAHAGQLGASCDSCHSATSWARSEAFTRHRRTRLPLSGMHALLECRDCHARAGERQWSHVPADCFACHAADYRRTDIHPSHVGVPGDAASPAFPRDCAQCHRATGWSPAFTLSRVVTGRQALSSLAEHERVFPLRQGAHRDADCQSCHVSARTARAVRCNGCHAHGEVALREQHRRVPGFSQACLACHPGGRAR
jgi:hypothetical protein